MDRACIACHSGDAATRVAPFSLTDWSAIEPLGEVIVDAVVSRFMPPLSGFDSCRELKDARSLTADERGLFARWLEHGLQQGDAADYVPPDEMIPGPDRVLETTATADSATGQTRCYRLGGSFEQNTFISALNLSATALSPLELVVVDSDADGCAADTGRVILRRGGAGRPVRYPESSSVALAAGERFEVRSTARSGSLELRDAGSVDPKLELWTLPDGARPAKIVVHERATAEVELAPGGPYQVFGNGLLQDAPGEIIAVDPGAGMLATRVYAGVRKGARQECVLDISPWDHAWQEEHHFAEPIQLEADDLFVFECAYDARADQPAVEGPRRAPQRAGQGDELLDERCEFDLWRLQPYAEL